MVVLRYAVVCGVAFVLCGAAVFAIAPMGLSVPGFVVMPLALLAGAVLASVGATWVSNLVAPGRGRLTLAAGSAGVAWAVSTGMWVVSELFGAGYLWPLIFPLSVCAGAISLGAGMGAMRWRATRDRLGWDGMVALLLSACVLMVLVRAGSVYLGLPSLGLALPLPDLATLSYAAVILCAVGVALAVWRSRNTSRGLARDAALTLALLAAVLPTVAGSIAIACASAAC